MRAKYCKCKNTYTMTKCNEKKCQAPDYWSQGLGSLTGGVVSNVDNQSTERTESNDRAGLWDVVVGGGVLMVSIVDGTNALPSYFPTAHYAFTQDETTGSGSGAVLLITVENGDVTGFSAVSVAGSGYQVGDEITMSQQNGFSITAVIVEVDSII